MSPQAVTTASAERLLYETADLDAARDKVGSTFAEHDLTLRDPRSLSLRLDLAVAPRLTVGRMSYGTHTFIDAPPMGTCYHVNLPLSGWSTVIQNGVRRQARAGEAGVAFQPTGPVTLTWSRDEEQYVIRLRKEQLEAHAAKLTGRPSEPVVFDLTFDLTSGFAQSLVSTARFVHTELTRPGGLSTMPVACHELESVLMTQLLMVIPSQLTPLLTAQPAPVRRTRIHDALDLIDADPGGDLTTAELAARTGISPRAMQVGFQDVVGMSPSAYIRGVRLDRVHYELMRGTPRSVTEVAMDWGFYHPGRFAQQYRERFGKLPSETHRHGGGGTPA